MNSKFVLLAGGPYEGETCHIHEGNRLDFHEPTGVVHVYRACGRVGVWEYDMEASAIATVRAEQKRSDRKATTI